MFVYIIKQRHIAEGTRFCSQRVPVTYTGTRRNRHFYPLGLNYIRFECLYTIHESHTRHCSYTDFFETAIFLVPAVDFPRRIIRFRYRSRQYNRAEENSIYISAQQDTRVSSPTKNDSERNPLETTSRDVLLKIVLIVLETVKKQKNRNSSPCLFVRDCRAFSRCRKILFSLYVKCRDIYDFHQNIHFKRLSVRTISRPTEIFDISLWPQ